MGHEMGYSFYVLNLPHSVSFEDSPYEVKVTTLPVSQLYSWLDRFQTQVSYPVAYASATYACDCLHSQT